jgi:ABC-type phosphate transport system permease subunit
MQGELPAPSIQYTSQAVRANAWREIDLRKKRRWGESAIQAFLFLCGAISILTTAGIVYVLGQEAWLFFRMPEVSVWEFVSKVKWRDR